MTESEIAKGNSRAAAAKAPPIHQASVAAILRDEGEPKVCLVTSMRTKSWILPKGIINPGRSAGETALREAFEEAGLEGRLVGEPIGHYEDFKWATTVEVEVFLMEVDAYLEKWAESHVRERRFVTFEEAADLVVKPGVQEMLRLAAARAQG